MRVWGNVERSWRIINECQYTVNATLFCVGFDKRCEQLTKNGPSTYELLSSDLTSFVYPDKEINPGCESCILLSSGTLENDNSPPRFITTATAVQGLGFNNTRTMIIGSPSLGWVYYSTYPNSNTLLNIRVRCLGGSSCKFGENGKF